MSLSSHEENKLKNAMDCHIFEQPMGLTGLETTIIKLVNSEVLHTVNVIYNISLERVRKVFLTFTFQLLHTIVVIMTFIT